MSEWKKLLLVGEQFFFIARKSQFINLKFFVVSSKIQLHVHPLFKLILILIQAEKTI